MNVEERLVMNSIKVIDVKEYLKGKCRQFDHCTVKDYPIPVMEYVKLAVQRRGKGKICVVTVCVEGEQRLLGHPTDAGFIQTYLFNAELICENKWLEDGHENRITELPDLPACDLYVRHGEWRCFEFECNDNNEVEWGGDKYKLIDGMDVRKLYWDEISVYQTEAKYFKKKEGSFAIAY